VKEATYKNVKEQAETREEKTRQGKRQLDGHLEHHGFPKNGHSCMPFFKDVTKQNTRQGKTTTTGLDETRHRRRREDRHGKTRQYKTRQI
jgi:hypothetical protein